MGCSLSSGQLSLSFNTNLQCIDQTKPTTLVLNSSTGSPGLVDDNLANTLGFSLNNIGLSIPYILYVGIPQTTTVAMTFVGKAKVTDPAVSVNLILQVDSKNKNININGKIVRVSDNKQLLQLTQISIDINAHNNLLEKFPSCVNPSTDIIPKLPQTFDGTQGNYTYMLKQINFMPIPSEHFTQEIQEEMPQISLCNYAKNNLLQIILIIIVLYLLYNYFKK
jgi:hypothetical protein